MSVLLYVAIMITVIVGVDLLFFRHQLWERLTVNIGIVLVFAAFYWRFLKHPWTVASCPDAMQHKATKWQVARRNPR